MNATVAREGIFPLFQPLYNGHWIITKDGDPDLLPLVQRHYSHRRGANITKGFVGPGRKIVLRTREADAVFAWLWAKPEYRADRFNCYYRVIFRNESKHLSSLLIAEAVQIATAVWGPPPPDGFITYVDPRKVASKNPGFCFLKAGWRKIGRSKKGKVILQLREREGG